jgi:CheY-like chemotaxis protein
MATQMKILVAEDDPNDSFLLRRAFSKAGVTVPIHFVRDGQEAIDYLQGKPPFVDVINTPPTMLLLDLKMPRLNGFDVLKWLRHQPALKGIFVVVLSSSGLEEDRRQAYALGADSYIMKPNDAQQLTALAQRFVDTPPRAPG